MTQENVVSMAPVPLEPLDEHELRFVETELLSHAGDIDPLSGLTSEVRELLRRLAFTSEMQLDVLEMAMRDKMRKANVAEKDIAKFNLGKPRKWAKQLRDQIDDANKRRLKIAQRNQALTASGKEDKELAAVADMPTGDQADALSSSPTLIAISWLNTHRKGRIWFCEFANTVKSDWDGGLGDQVIPEVAVDDAWLLAVYVTLLRSDTRLAKMAKGHAESAAYHVAFKDRRNEPLEWLRSLTWDKVPRLETMLHRVYGATQDSYHAAVGRCWFVSMAARISRPGCKVDTMPVLFGPEGTNKSTSLAVIGGKWYATINVSAEKMVDFLMTLSGVLVGEIAELDALMNKRTETSRVKTLLSTYEDKYRAPYARVTSSHRRVSVLVGTTNELGWHRDDTGGGRRFWPIECRTAIDLEWLRQWRDQLFAEALDRYVAGESWWDVPIEKQREKIAEHYTGDPLTERLEQWLSDERFYVGSEGSVQATGPDASGMEEWECWGTTITTSRIMTVLMQMPIEKQSRHTSIRVAQAMHKLGWVNRAVRLGSGRSAKVAKAWVRGDAEVADQGQLFDKTDE